MYFLYSVLLTLGLAALLPRFILDAWRHGKYVAGLRERLGILPAFDANNRPVIWLHAASVGEAQAARTLVRALLDKYPAHALVVSTITLTGQRVAREAFGRDAALVFYFPFDWAWSVRRALRHINPSVVLIMETELWPRFLRECSQRAIPIALVNGRLSERSMRGYRRLGKFVERMVNDLTLALMQTKEDAARIAALGLAGERIAVSGNIKFDAQDEPGEGSLTADLRARFQFTGARPLLVAASTHAPEERITLEAFKEIWRASPVDERPRLLIAPRHPERFNEVAALFASHKLSWTRRTHAPATLDATCDVVLLDSIGELRAVYTLARIVFVGGSIAQTGGHNILEPAAAGTCIVTGAHTQNFAAIIKAFQAQDALVQLPTMPEAEVPRVLANVLTELLANDERRETLARNARTVFEQNQGATKRTLELLAPLFDSPVKVTSL
ncbi:MAG: 3-deoxy-D-manno-octulosonic acid transferase [Pyrinomonadaceae bacterium]